MVGNTSFRLRGARLVHDSLAQIYPLTELRLSEVC